MILSKYIFVFQSIYLDSFLKYAIERLYLWVTLMNVFLHLCYIKKVQKMCVAVESCILCYELCLSPKMLTYDFSVIYIPCFCCEIEISFSLNVIMNMSNDNYAMSNNDR